MPGNRRAAGEGHGKSVITPIDVTRMSGGVGGEGREAPPYPDSASDKQWQQSCDGTAGSRNGRRKEHTMTEQKAGQEVLSPQQLEHLWAEHLKGEFATKDVEATLATMVEDAYVNHMPVNTGGRGKDALRTFYRDDFIPSWPDDLQMTPVNRVVGAGQLVDELHLMFTHSKPMPWFLPNVLPSHKK